MPDRCVVYGCNNTKDHEHGISIHKIPYFGDVRPEAKKRRKRWTDFVKQKRAKWSESKFSVICSEHFVPEDFQRQYSSIPGMDEPYRRSLVADQLGTTAFPTIFEPKARSKPTERSRRQLMKEVLADKAGPSGCASVQMDSAESIVDELQLDALSNPYETQATELEVPQMEAPTVCQSCVILTRQVRKYKHQWMAAKFKLNNLRKVSNRDQVRSNQECDDHVGDVGDDDDDGDDDYGDDDYGDNDTVNDSMHEEFEEEPIDDVDFETTAEFIGATEAVSDDEYDDDIGSLRKQPKFIVFLTQLLALFKFCPTCKADHPLIEVEKVGTMAKIKLTCSNDKCEHRHSTWHSQPFWENTKIPAGNLLLSFGILLAGGTATKALHILKIMGVSCMTLTTFFRHQREILFPAIHTHWQNYQIKLLERLQQKGESLVVAGDGRHDSMGHSAKFGAYSMMLCTIPMIIHFAIVQSNEVSGSPAMEFEGFKRCIAYLFGAGLTISTFISDRHQSIAKHLKEKLPNIKHYFDLWHLKKKIQKDLTKISKTKGCEELSNWIKPCIRHLYWSATTTRDGNGAVILAKFRAFFQHVINKHENFDEPLFNKCLHGKDITEKKWLDEDDAPYEKMTSAVLKESFLKGVRQASPIAQTSCLEAFHSVLNHFCPKMIHFSHAGMYCRHALASIHFNCNILRDVRRNKDGTEQVNVTYPKFKNGEATVRSIRVVPNYAYIDEIYNTMASAAREGELEHHRTKLKEMAPPPINTIFEKQPRGEAIQKRDARLKIATQDIPPTNPVPEHSHVHVGDRKVRAKPTCKKCKLPMKGHNNAAQCLSTKEDE